MCLNQSGLSLKTNWTAIDIAINSQNHILMHPTDDEIEENEVFLTLVCDIFKGSEGVLELLQHKGYFDFNILNTTKFKDALAKECEKSIERLKELFTSE